VFKSMATSVNSLQNSFICDCIWTTPVDPVERIDYRCDDSRFWVSARLLQGLNPALLPSSERQVHLGIRTKKCLSESGQCQQAIGGIYFTQTWRPEALHHALEIGKSQPRSKVGNFEYISWLKSFVFWGLNIGGILKEGVKTYLMAPMSPLNSPTFFSSSHL
jgi:hypothetical protein